MKYFSLFSGAGGFEQGIHKAIPTAECVGYSEIDKYAIKTYEKHYPKHKNYGNCECINWSEVPNFDLLVGGSPCQDLSIAGKQAGIGGYRSGLFREYIKGLKEKKPRYFLWENVKGALSSNKGWDFTIIISEMAEAGYDVQWQVLNAKDFGVPQNRERVFVVGHLRGKTRPKVFPFGESNSNTKSRNKERSYASTLQTSSTRCRGTHVIVRESTKKLVKPELIRKLTPLECERLMGWFDDWTEGVSDAQRYKQCGNGVVSNCVEEIVKRIIK